MAKRKNTGLIVGALAAVGVAGAAYLGLRKSSSSTTTKGLGCGCSGKAGELGAVERMQSEAWRDGGYSWVDVTPDGGPRMRITHQVLGRR